MITIVGKGKAGGSLAKSAARARIGVGAFVTRVSAVKGARSGDDVLFLAVPDDVIEACAAELATRATLPALIVHMSGAKGPSALAALTASSATSATSAPITVGCFHPLASLDGKSPIPKGTLVAVDASGPHATRAIATLTKLARRFGCVPVLVAEDKRALYHAGAVVAGNLPVALLAMGTQLLVDAGVPAELARVSLARLLRSQADSAVSMPLAEALTGPVARADFHTLERHLEELSLNHDDVARVYRELSTALVDNVADHPPAVRSKLRRALEK